MTDDPSHIMLRVISHPEYLCVVRAAVETAATRLGFGSDDAGKITLAVDEALANVIRHGYHGQTDGPIWVKMSPQRRGESDGMLIVIEDACRGVDLSRIKPRPLEEVRPGGLGVNIIQSVMDHVDYATRAEGEGVRLTMFKSLAPTRSARQGKSP